MKGPFWLIRMVCLVMGCSAMSCGDSSTPEDKPTEESTDTGASVEATDAGDELASSPDAGSQDAATPWTAWFSAKGQIRISPAVASLYSSIAVR